MLDQYALYKRVLSVGVVGVALVLALLGRGALQAATPVRVALHEKPIEGEQAWLTVYRPEKPNGTAIVICPGGGYGEVVVEPEGHGIARWLNQHRITGLVLEYRLPRGRHLVPITDALKAITTAREKAKQWQIDPKRIGIMGFSAGGHLAATAATHFKSAKDRPDFSILVYPVITMGAKTHAGSFHNLLGKAPSQETIDRYSNEKRVTSKTPPTFLAHATDDKAVPPENSRLFFAACRKHGVTAEYLELPDGGHGLNGYKGASWDAWQKQSLVWLGRILR
jgi:acetyl esterase/lipase